VQANATINPLYLQLQNMNTLKGNIIYTALYVQLK